MGANVRRAGRCAIRTVIIAICFGGNLHLAHAQETVNYASVSGRVTDPQGAVVPGAHVTARQMDTNVSAEPLTNSEGRFRFPYLKVGPYEIDVHLDGFADIRRRLTLTIGSAFDLPLPLTIAGLGTSVTVTGQAPVLEAARSQIAGTVPQVEVQNLPMNPETSFDRSSAGMRRAFIRRWQHPDNGQSWRGRSTAANSIIRVAALQ